MLTKQVQQVSKGNSLYLLVVRSNAEGPLISSHIPSSASHSPIATEECLVLQISQIITTMNTKSTGTIDLT